MKKRVVIPVNNSKALVALAKKVNEKHFSNPFSIFKLPHHQIDSVAIYPYKVAITPPSFLNDQLDL